MQDFIDDIDEAEDDDWENKFVRENVLAETAAKLRAAGKPKGGGKGTTAAATSSTSVSRKGAAAHTAPTPGVDMPSERHESELFVHDPQYPHIPRSILSDKNLSKTSFHNLLTDPRFIAAKAHRFVMGEESDSSEEDEDVRANKRGI